MGRKVIIKIKGTKLQKICLVFQFVIIVMMLVFMIYANVKDIEGGVTGKILNLSVFLVCVFMWLPILFSGDKEDK